MSDNNLDRKAAEWLVQSLVPSPPASNPDRSPPPLIDFDSPRPDKLTTEQKEDAAENAETHEGEEEEEDQRELEPLFEVAPLLREEKDGQAGAVLSLRLENCGLRGQVLEVLGEHFAFYQQYFLRLILMRPL